MRSHIRCGEEIDTDEEVVWLRSPFVVGRDEFASEPLARFWPLLLAMLMHTAKPH
jgi:hypothetical protein